MEPEQEYIYHLLNLTLHMGPNVRCVVYSSTPCSIRSSLRLRKNIEWMIQNNSGNKKRTTVVPTSINRLPVWTALLLGGQAV